MNNLRFIPAAITPVFIKDILRSIYSHLRGIGINSFEEKISLFFSQKKTFTFSSLMRTNYACLFALSSFDKRKKIIIPRYACPSFVHAILAAKLEIIYCDSDYKTLNYDLDKLLKIDFTGVLAVICPNLFGLSNDVEKIINICKGKSIYVVGVDYGIGTEINNKRIGTYGDVTILNFQEGKALPIGGGAIVTSNSKVISFFNKKRNMMNANIITMFGYAIFSRPFFYNIFIKLTRFLSINRKKFSMEDTIRNTKSELDYDFDVNEYNVRISNFQASLGIILLDRLISDINKRRLICRIYENGFLNLNQIDLIDKIENLNFIHYIRYPILVKNNKRDIVLRVLLNHRIEASPMYIEHGVCIDNSKYPGANKINKELLTLPCHPYVNFKDAHAIVKLIQQIF